MRKILLSFTLLALTMFLTTACSGAQRGTPESQEPAKVQSTKAYVYTADEGGSISKVDVSTNKVVETIKQEGSVHNVQVSPNGKILGATLVPEGSMSSMSGDAHMEMKGIALFLDTSNDQLIKKVEVGEHPAHIDFTNDGKYALVTNNESNNVSVIDLSSYQVIKTIGTGNGPHGFRISKDSKFAYVANLGSDTISVLDLIVFKEVTKIKVGKTPITTAVTSDGKTMFASVNAENSLAMVDLATKKIDKIAVGTGPAQIYLQSDDKNIFVANQGTEQKPSNSVSKIDLATRQVVATIETGKGAHGLVVTTDNKYVFVTNMYDDTISVIDNNNNKVIGTVNVGKTPNGISFLQSK
ncbi:40-residue YVTN family beta-propeller [Desulfosporosinus sp. HMP52]|uniref:YVTN family beta-propeller repeat protein n=1 Tax=Desulfosporosinus sp. HMP52 TaxID=1487923 RepID=UPI00051FE7BD|nr:YncE family protein [Desulfosporosinus sp. HMP52]KGK89148.1 40-residue YVTN family beta-propeller [Desulfosporosinus sp. HMP52]